MSNVSLADKFLTLEPIAFVTSTSLSSPVHQKQRASPKEILLDGEEVSRFYEEVISSPTINNSIEPSSKAVERRKSKNQCYVKQPKIQLLRPSSNSMFKCAETGDLDGMKKCLNSGLNINSTDMYGWTCLMCAACSGSKNMITYLLKSGARKDLHNSTGKTAVDLANDFGHTEVVEILTNGEFVDASETKAITHGKVPYFCKLCKKEFREEKSKHETSITHQLSLIRPKKHTHYHLPESNIGFQMMLKEGWDKDKGLGPDGSGNKFPVKTIMKKDRSCLGNKTTEKPRITHFQPFDVSAVKNIKQPVVTVRQRTLNKWQRAKKNTKDKQKEINFRRQFY